jgi:hypothetical protein
LFLLVFDLAAIASAAARIAVRKSGDGGNGTQVLLQHLLVVGYGPGGVFAFIGHRLRADEVARSIGWPTGNPFQEEIAWANLGAGIVGLGTHRTRSPSQSPHVVRRHHHVASYLRHTPMNEGGGGGVGVGDNYGIRLKGQLGARWADWFDRLTLTNAGER